MEFIIFIYWINSSYCCVYDFLLKCWLIIKYHIIFSIWFSFYNICTFLPNVVIINLDYVLLLIIIFLQNLLFFLLLKHSRIYHLIYLSFTYIFWFLRFNWFIWFWINWFYWFNWFNWYRFYWFNWLNWFNWSIRGFWVCRLSIWLFRLNRLFRFIRCFRLSWFFLLCWFLVFRLIVFHIFI